MPHPFPGMNRWLEDARLWRDVHQSLITTLRDVLAPQLEPRYFVAVETHAYVSASPTQPIRTRYPDASILKIGEAATAYTLPHGEAMPLLIDLPLPEPYEEPYLEVRLLPDGEVVTVIELLSHTNKRAGDERRSYLEKRAALIDSAVHFVEIDLLRAHEPMPFSGHVAADYRIFIRGASWDGGRTSTHLRCASRSPPFRCPSCPAIRSRRLTLAPFCMTSTTAPATSS